MRSTFTVVDSDSKVLGHMGENYSNMDIDVSLSQRKYSYKKIKMFAVTTGLVVAILLCISVLLVQHHPHLKFWESANENSDETPIEVEKDITDVLTTKTEGPSQTPPSSRIHHHRIHHEPPTPIAASNTTESLDNMKYLIEPTKYKIYLHLSSNPFDEWSFQGNVTINIKAKEKTNYIVIGANALRIVTVRLAPTNPIARQNEFYEIAIDSYNTNEGLLVLQTYKPLKPFFEYALDIEYYGDMQFMSYGLFQIISTLPDQQRTKTLIASNTETPFARTIFPCFDLHTQFATYELHVCRDHSMVTKATCASVMETSDIAEKCTWDHFETTPPLPPQSFGFAISDYFSNVIMVKHDLQMTVWTVSNQNKETAYVSDILPKLIDFYEDYFDMKFAPTHLEYYGVPAILPYITSKMGIIVVPESDMMVKENETSEYQKEKVAKTAAAHLAEQWMELLTFNDYQDHWIKDSLVQYLQYRAIDSIEPSWKIFDEFFTTVLQNEMDAEILNPSEKSLNVIWIPHLKRLNTPQLIYPLNETLVFQHSKTYTNILYSTRNERETDPTIYSELFVQRNINKGVCLLRMLEHILTENVFRNAIKKFLEYGETNMVKAEDLWNIMTTEATNSTVPGYQLLPNSLTLESVVNEWLFIYDFPIVKVVRNYDTGEVSFVQFLDLQEYASSYRIRTFRHLPISYTTEEERFFSSTAPKMWLKNAKKTVMQNPITLTNSTWLLVNPQQTGLYRVNYDDENWNMLKKALENGDLPANIRAQLLDDALFLGRRGYLNYEFALSLTKSLSVYGEKEFIVWNTVLRHFTYIENIIHFIGDDNFQKHRTLFKNYIKELIAPVYDSLVPHNTNDNLDDIRTHYSDHSTVLLRALIFDWACKIGIQECHQRMKKEFNEWKLVSDPDDKNPVDPNMRYAVLCNAMRYGDSSDFEFLYNRFLNASSTDPQKPIYLRSLYCYNQISYTLPSILSDTLLNNYSLTHLNDVNDIWQALAEIPTTCTVPLDYLLTYWKSILKKFSDFGPILKNIIEGATANVNKEEQLNALYRLRQDTENMAHLKDIFHDVVKHIKLKINWKYQELNIFLSWLGKLNEKDEAVPKSGA